MFIMHLFYLADIKRFHDKTETLNKSNNKRIYLLRSFSLFYLLQKIFEDALMERNKLIQRYTEDMKR